MLKSLPKFYKRSAGELYFFGWMVSFRKCLPSLSEKQCVLKFINDHDLIEGKDTEVKTMVSTFQRMRKEFFDANKTENNQ